jgi:nucleoid-associated protein YgaU
MTRETRVGLLVGLMLIVMFGLVLSELAGKQDGPESPLRAIARDDPTARGGPVIEDPSPLVVRRTELAAGRHEPAVAVHPLPDPTPGTVDVAILPADPGPRTAVAEVVSRREAAPGPTARPADPVVAVGPTPPAPIGQKYVVQPNDSLIKIARKCYGENNVREYKRIYEANKGILSSESFVPVGKELVIPPLPVAARGPAPSGPGSPLSAAGSPPPSARVPAPTAAPAVETARRTTEMTVEEVARHFGAGTSPTPSGSSPAASAAPAPRRVHVIQRGDSLAKIARQYLRDDSRASVLRIYNANKDKLANPNVLPIGTELTIPS